jgi:hypothetical protein
MAKALALAAGLLAAALTATLTGCFGGAAAFNCELDTQCNAGTGGRCEPNNFCSYMDSACPGGQRYGQNSGGLSGVCVGQEPGPDGGMRICYGATDGLVRPCFPSAPTDDVMLPAMIDTGASDLCSTNVTSVDNSTNNYCVIAGATIGVADGAVNVTGAKPLVLFATNTITIGARLDASSRRSPSVKIGPGADPTSCDMGTPPGDNGGGAGGSMIGRGGAGGGNAAGVNGGTSGAAQTITTLRGGCRGQKGGTGALGGDGGHGGGAVYLIAEGSITIMAPITASGQGGLGGAQNGAGTTGGGGGGGGGSGGMIGLDSPMITNMATGLVVANGASGAEGGSAGNGGDGVPGFEPVGVAASMPSGGSSMTGGDGGGGSAAVNADGGTGLNGLNMGNPPRSGGGGGGGGGIGLIKVFRGTIMGPGLVSPNPS